jgi:hypothetical protein
MKVSVSPMYVQALSTSKRSIKEVYIPNEYLADRKNQHIIEIELPGTVKKNGNTAMCLKKIC